MGPVAGDFLPAFVKHPLFRKATMVSAASLIYYRTGVPPVSRAHWRERLRWSSQIEPERGIREKTARRFYSSRRQLLVRHAKLCCR
jgi:hypothetical protein